jgi:hypothetical protein
MTEQEIREQIENNCVVNWDGISQYQTLSEEFIREFKDYVEWYLISKSQILSEDFIREFKDRVYWSYISYYQTLSEEFIREFKDCVEWYWISQSQTLSEDFIREFKDCVEWDKISRFQTLSESFIKEFKDCVKWYLISRYQTLSEEFIREFQDYVGWHWISYCQTLSEDFIKEFNLEIPEHNWLYTDKEAKRKAIIDCKLYEIIDDCVIAYKGVKKNGKSKFSNQYHYEVGKTYTSRADHNCDHESSFGLSSWTLEEAKDYCNEKVFKVAIPLDCVAALVHDCHKIRSTQLTILEEVS